MDRLTIIRRPDKDFCPGAEVRREDEWPIVDSNGTTTKRAVEVGGSKEGRFAWVTVLLYAPILTEWRSCSCANPQLSDSRISSSSWCIPK